MIAYAFCGSFCTVARSIGVLRELMKNGEEILPVMSEIVYSTDTRFAAAEAVRREVEEICGRSVLHTVRDAEPIGPKIAPELLVVAPCTGNTLAKVANGITDTAVTMAIKSQLRSDRPVLIALATNDGLSANLKTSARSFAASTSISYRSCRTIPRRSRTRSLQSLNASRTASRSFGKESRCARCFFFRNEKGSMTDK